MEPKPTEPGTQTGDLSPDYEWVWRGPTEGWVPTDTAEPDAAKPLDL